MRRTLTKLVLMIGIVLSVLITGCSSKANVDVQSGDDRITVYTSFYTMNDFVKKIGGDKVKLQNLVPTGTEPHDWEPSPKDIVNIGKADVFIYNGAGMEGWVEKILESLNNKKLIVVEAAKDIKLLEGEHGHEGENDVEHKDEHEELKYDPHIWLNPLLAKVQMEAIKNALVAADSVNKDYYEKNYSDNAKKLDELDSEYKNALSKYTKRDIIVAHKAFGYLCEAYGLRQVAIEGLNAESEPTPARMSEIIDFARKNNVKVIFFEELINPKVANAIAREIGAQTKVLSPLEGLREEDIQAGKEYFAVMKENLESIKKALE